MNQVPDRFRRPRSLSCCAVAAQVPGSALAGGETRGLTAWAGEQEYAGDRAASCEKGNSESSNVHHFDV